MDKTIPIENDYENLCDSEGMTDKDHLFCILIGRYIRDGVVGKHDYALIGQLYATITDYVDATYNE